MPQELLDNIVNALQDSPTTLSALSVAARCFHFSARQRLFRSPTIVTSHTSFVSLLDTLRHAPLHVRYYVENITLALTDFMGARDGTPPPDSVTPFLIASLLQLLPNLDSLTLDGVVPQHHADHLDEGPEWQEVHGIERLSLTGMRTLIEDGFRDFLPLTTLLGTLDGFPMLDVPTEFLQFPFAAAAPMARALSPPTPPPPGLAVAPPTHDWLRGFAQTRALPGPLRTLEGLDVALHTPGDAAHVGAFLRLAGMRLVRFGCALHARLAGAPPDELVRALALRESCPALERVALRSAVDARARVVLLLGLAAALALRVPPAVRTFALELDLGRDVARARGVVRSEVHGWAVLKDALGPSPVAHVELVWRYTQEGWNVIGGDEDFGMDSFSNRIYGMMDGGAFTLASYWETY